MIERYDLHCHSTASDGALTPTEVVQRAAECGVTALALTDHDTTAGLVEAQQQADLVGLRLIPGIELSCNWQNKCLHVVGLGIDPSYTPLANATHLLQSTRLERAEKIAFKLEQKRIPGAMLASLGWHKKINFAERRIEMPMMYTWASRYQLKSLSESEDLR